MKVKKIYKCVSLFLLGCFSLMPIQANEEKYTIEDYQKIVQKKRISMI